MIKQLGWSTSLQIEALPHAFELLPERPPDIELDRCMFSGIWGAVLQRTTQVAHQVQFQVHCQVVESLVLASGDVLNSVLTDVSDNSVRYQ